MLVPSEDEHIEFKEAKTRLELDTAADYCIALANEGGGKLILGVSNQRPRRVVGTQAFRNPRETQRRLLDSIRLDIDIEEIAHPDGRVVVLHAPSRPPATPLHHKGRYLMRSGESLVPLTPDQLRRIFEESTPDFSATICPGAALADLAPQAIDALRTVWRRKSGNARIDELTDEQMLADLGLADHNGVTYAALILLGDEQAVRQYLPNAEVIYEYRSQEASIRYNDREEFCSGFLLMRDAIWDIVDARNDSEPYQDGLWLLEIPVFNEAVVREAILNAVSHRDYRRPGSIFIKQFPRKMQVINPGGFPDGVTEENILYTQVPRNRRLAEVLARCGLVERSGQGVDLMFRDSLRHGKRRPEYTGTDEHHVVLTLHGEVQDPSFVRFLEDVAQDEQVSFSTEDLIILDLLKREQPVPERLRHRFGSLVDAGVIERKGRNRHILSQRYYKFVGRTGAYTRVAGLNRERSRLLLLTCIEQNGRDGTRMKDLMDVVPHLTRPQVKTLLADLRQQSLVHCVGVTRNARWYPGAGPEDGLDED